MKILFAGLLALPLLMACSLQAGDGMRPEATSMPAGKSLSADAAALMAEVAPQFRQLQFKKDGMTLNYSLFAPKNIEPGKKYPLVVFMPAGAVPAANGQEQLAPGYGALVFASAQAQKDHSCYVLAPRLAPATNGASTAPEAAALPSLVKSVCQANAIDAGKIYLAGQGAGGAAAMSLNVANPDLFAASLYVDCLWDKTGLDRLVKRPFIFIYAADSGKGAPMKEAIEAAARKTGVSYTWSEWSAELPQDTQDGLAAAMLAKNQPVNIIGLENGAGGGQGGNIDSAYRLAPARDWLFRHALKNPN